MDSASSCKEPTSYLLKQRAFGIEAMTRRGPFSYGSERLSDFILTDL